MVVVLCHAKILFEMTNNSFYCSSPTTFLSFHLFLMQRIALTRRGYVPILRCYACST